MAYKNIKTYKKGYLHTRDFHQIYYELSGNPKGNPVLFVHGGPGGGFSEKDKRFFNPKKFNIITFDQRGAGRSKPFASIKNNTTHHLVEDIKNLLDFFGIQRVILFGGSWGSTLSLAYAIKYPRTVKAMVLRGIFLGNKEENNYFTDKAKDTFPEAWEKMIGLVPKNNRKNIIRYYYKMMQSKDKETRKKYTLAWATYEFSISKIVFSMEKLSRLLKEIKYEAFSLIELYYLIHNCFIPKGHILNNAGRLNFPVSIIHGRYDKVCPPLSAYLLHKKIKSSKLFFTIAGHSASDEENEKMLIKEINSMANIK